MPQDIEYIDLVDTSGNVKLRNLPRSEADQYPDLHMQIVVGVIFDREKRILVHQRAKTKSVNPGDVDHICGGIQSGETPEEALLRETMEEAGVNIRRFHIVQHCVNTYKRYRYLIIGETDDEPGSSDPAEVEWVRFMHLDELKQGHTSGELTFVDEFFEDTAQAMQCDFVE